MVSELSRRSLLPTPLHFGFQILKPRVTLAGMVRKMNKVMLVMEEKQKTQRWDGKETRIEKAGR
jgi:hypothetical protein